jgi:predicted ferric reductase
MVLYLVDELVILNRIRGPRPAGHPLHLLFTTTPPEMVRGLLCHPLSCRSLLSLAHVQPRYAYLLLFIWIVLISTSVMRALGSQYYCYAAIAVWSAAVLWRHGAVLFGLARHMARGRGLPRATFEMMPGGLIRVVLRTSMSWQPGQHIFLRVLDCRPAETHPFTIASIPRQAGATGQDAEGGAVSDDGLNELVLLIRPGDGFTSSLTKVITMNSSNGQSVVLPVLVDGPYGEAAHLQTFDSVLLIAGGTGVSFVLPIFRDVLHATVETGSCSRLSLMWAARDTGELFCGSCVHHNI